MLGDPPGTLLSGRRTASGGSQTNEEFQRDPRFTYLARQLDQSIVVLDRNAVPATPIADAVRRHTHRRCHGLIAA